MNIPITTTETSKLKTTLMTIRGMTGQSIPLTLITPIVIPNANQFAGYSGGQKYFRVEVSINFTEITELDFNGMPSEPIII